MRKVYGYCRVSTEQQDTKRQIDLISRYCETNNYELVDIIQEKISGAKSDRKSINRLLDLDATLCDIIVVSELSRISRERDILKVLNTINELLQNGLDVVFLDEPYKTYSAGKQLELYDIITLSVKAQGAAEERLKIKERMKTGKISKVDRYPFAYVGGIVPYGFKLIDNIATAKHEPRQLLTIDEQTISNVKIIFDSVINGRTLRDTAKYINKLGLRTINGLEFNLNGVRMIVRNPIYYGQRPLKGQLYPIECDVITEDEFNLANQRLKANQIFKNKGIKHFNPLKGIFKCACGKSMLMRIFNSKKHTNYIFYQCLSKSNAQYKDKGCSCANNGTEGKIVLDSVWKIVKATLKQEEYITTNKKQIRESEHIIQSLVEKTELINAEIGSNVKEMNTIESNLTKISNDTLLKKFEKRYSELIENNNQLNKNKETVYKEVKKIKDEISYLNTTIIDEEITEEEKSKLFRSILEQVTYYSFKRFKGFILVRFKNGLESIIAVRTGNYGFSAQLPFTFRFNKDERTVIVEYHNIDTPSNAFVFNPPTYKEYTFDTLVKAIDLRQYYIE